MDRRALLVALPGVCVPGCLGVGTGDRVRVAWVRLVNQRTDPADVIVSIEDGSDRVFHDSYRLAATNGGRELDPDVEGLGRYVARFVADGQTVDVDLAESVEGGPASVGISFELHAEGTLGYETRIV